MIFAGIAIAIVLVCGSYIIYDSCTSYRDKVRHEVIMERNRKLYGGKR